MATPPSGSQPHFQPPLGATAPDAKPKTEPNLHGEAGRAADNAIRSIFELARSLEFLSEALGRVRSETLPSGERDNDPRESESIASSSASPPADKLK